MRLHFFCSLKESNEESFFPTNRFVPFFYFFAVRKVFLQKRFLFVELGSIKAF